MTRSRSAFTLLEVLLALGIAVLLMAALYVAVDVQIRSTQEGRERIDQSTLIRALLTRIGTDLSAAVGPVTAPTAAAEATSETTTSTTSTTTTTTETSSTSTATAEGETTSTNLNAVVPFSAGVIGDEQLVAVYTSTARGLRRVTYWLTEVGLARAEIANVAGDDDPFAVPEDAANVIAPEVISWQLEYFDGTGWLTAWDGSIPGSDGTTPIGPPRAIAVTLELERPGRDDPVIIRHVIATRTPGGGTAATATTAAP